MSELALPIALEVHEDHVVLDDGRVVHGATADRWLEEAPELAPELAAALGEVAGRLGAVDLGPATGWRARWEAHAESLYREVVARGLDLGAPLERAAGPRAWPALDGTPRLGLVHGDLGLHVVWLDEHLAPVTVLGLERCTPGDPLVDIAALLRLGDPAMRAIAVEAAAPRLRGSGVERVEAYLRAGLLTELSSAPLDADARALHLERVRARFDEVEFVALLLRGGPRRLEVDDPVVAARRALEASSAIASPEERAAWLGALGASLLASAPPVARGPGGEVAHRLGLVARELSRRLPHGGTGRPSGPPHPGVVKLAGRAIALLEGAVGAHIHAGLGVASSLGDGPVASALEEAARVQGAPASRSLPLPLLEAVCDDELQGVRAALPAVAWAAWTLASHGQAARGEDLLRSALVRG